MQPGRPWILMTGHRISCQKSKFPYLYFLFRYSLLSLCTDIPPPSKNFWGRGDIYTQAIFFSASCTSLCSPIFTNIPFVEVFLNWIIGTPAFVLFQHITSLYKKDLNDAWTFTSVQGNEKWGWVWLKSAKEFTCF